MRQIGMAAGILGCLFLAHSAMAAIGASVSVTAGQLNSSNGKYDYTLSLTNTGDTNISTLWFGWVVYPGFNYIYDLLPSDPSSVNSPGTWTGTHGADGIIGGYYSAEWTTTTPLAPGQTMNGFTLETADAPAIINGGSNFGYADNTSWVYQNIYAGISNSGASSGPITPSVVPVPEPTLAILLPGLMLLARRRKVAR